MSLHRPTLGAEPELRGGISGWLVVSQGMIDRFAESTLDPDPLHIDAAWAAKHGPFGGTVAFGFLTISLLTYLVRSAFGAGAERDPGEWIYLNYGFDHLRLVAPVPSGARIRGHFAEARRAQDEKGRWRITFDCRVEIEGQERPALVAEWVAICLPPAP